MQSDATSIVRPTRIDILPAPSSNDAQRRNARCERDGSVRTATPSTRDLIEAAAARDRYVLVPEPSRGETGVVTGRYAIVRFNLEAASKPSHAGATLAAGRSAIREMARRIIEIDGMTTADCTFSVDIVHGGHWVNCVASRCTGLEQPAASRQCGRALCRKPEALAAQAGLAQYLLPEISEIA